MLGVCLVIHFVEELVYFPEMRVFEPLELPDAGKAGRGDDNYFLLLDKAGEIRGGEDILFLPTDGTTHLPRGLCTCLPFHVLSGP